MIQKIKIVPAVIDDLSRIVEIYNQAVRKHQTGDLTELTPELRTQWFEEHDFINFPVFVACEDNKIRGWLSISRYRPGRDAFKNVGEISYYVDQNYSGQHIGRQLVEHVLEYLKNKDLRILIAIILGTNTRSIKFIKQFGFEIWAQLPSLAEIEGQLIDHVYMGKRLK